MKNVTPLILQLYIQLIFDFNMQMAYLHLHRTTCIFVRKKKEIEKMKEDSEAERKFDTVFISLSWYCIIRDVILFLSTKVFTREEKYHLRCFFFYFQFRFGFYVTWILSNRVFLTLRPCHRRRDANRKFVLWLLIIIKYYIVRFLMRWKNGD